MRNLSACLKVLVAFLLFAGSARAEVSVENAWVRLPPPVADTAAAYMSLHNRSKRDVVISSVSCDASQTAEIHDMRIWNDMMHMYMLEQVTIPAQGSITLKPGGMHMMLIGLKQALTQGQQVRIILHFADGGRLSITAEVRDMRATPQHHDMQH